MRNLLEKMERDDVAGSDWPTLTESKDPADYAKELLATSPNLKKMIDKKVTALVVAMMEADKKVKQLDKFGAGGALGAVEFIKGKIMARAKDLQETANMVVGELEKTQK